MHGGASASFKPDAIRNEKAKLMDAVRCHDAGRSRAKRRPCGQYGLRKEGADGTVTPGYREEPDVNPQSATETFAAIKLQIDNWRWEGVPIYLRSGKALWKAAARKLSFSSRKCHK